MYTMRQIRRFVSEIANRFRPQKIILFGSYAYGTPNEDSDVDLMVLMDCPRPRSKQTQIRCALDAPFPLDLLLRTPREFAQRIEWGDYFLEEIRDKGRVLYEATDAGMGQEGGGRLRKRATRSAGAKGAQLRRRGVSRAAVR